MEDTNQVVIIGRLASEPEVPHPAILSLRVGSTTRGKVDGEWQDKSNFFDVKLFGEKRVAALSNLLRKGSRICVSGQLEMDEWEQEGRTRSKLFIRATGLQLVDGASQGSRPATDLPVSDPPKGTEPATADDYPF